MSTATAHTPTEIASGIAATIQGIFETIDGWRDDVQRAIAALPALSAAAIDPIAAVAVSPALTGDSLLTGAGFIATPGALDDTEWHLAWWLRGADAPRRLATIDDPSHEQFRDYTALEWWRVPERTGTRHLTGPYVDYVCTDDYTVTVTTPVTLDGRLVGLVGADALVDRLERELLPLLRSTARPATIVNSSGRVVTSSDARREPGSLLRLDGLAEAIAGGAASVVLPSGATALACGDTSLTLVIQ